MTQRAKRNNNCDGSTTWRASASGAGNLQPIIGVNIITRGDFNVSAKTRFHLPAVAGRPMTRGAVGVSVTFCTAAAVRLICALSKCHIEQGMTLFVEFVRVGAGNVSCRTRIVQESDDVSALEQRIVFC
jgi:hypothetical protein